MPPRPSGSDRPTTFVSNGKPSKGLVSATSLSTTSSSLSAELEDALRSDDDDEDIMQDHNAGRRDSSRSTHESRSFDRGNGDISMADRQLALSTFGDSLREPETNDKTLLSSSTIASQEKSSHNTGYDYHDNNDQGYDDNDDDADGLDLTVIAMNTTDKMRLKSAAAAAAVAAPVSDTSSTSSPLLSSLSTSSAPKKTSALILNPLTSTRQSSRNNSHKNDHVRGLKVGSGSRRSNDNPKNVNDDDLDKGGVKAAAATADGAATKRIEAPETPLKTLQVTIISLVAFVNILNSVIIFPFLPFFTTHFYPDIPLNEIGSKIGVLASAYFFGDMLGSLMWGRFADTYGRKAAVNIGLITSFVGILAFPFAPTYWTAFLIRFASGLLCGNNSLTRTMLSEVCDDTNQGRGMAQIGQATGLARLIAPGIGGWFALPATKYDMFQNTIFDTFPYFLPCLIGGVITFFGIVLVTFYLEETLPPRPDFVGISLLPNAAYKKREQEMGVALKNNVGDDSFLRPTETERHRESVCDVVMQPTVLNIILIYFIHSFVGVISHEIIPMWVVNSTKHHGFGFNTSQIGTILTIVAPFQILSQAFVYPVLAARWKYIKLFKVSSIFYGIALILMPYTALLNESPTYILWPAFVSVIALAVCSRIAAFTCIFVLLSNSCSKEVRGSINGIGQAASSFGRMLGPTFAGFLFAWSLNNDQPFPFNYHFLFMILTVCCALSYLFATWLSDDVNFQKKSTVASSAHKEAEDDEDDLSEEDDKESLLKKVKIPKR